MSEIDNATAARIEQVWEMVEPLVQAEGMELVEVEYRRESHGWVLRLFIDRVDGVSLDDCATMSRVIGDLLDTADLIHNPYHLEVSSPGLNRPLRKWEHFQSQIGNIVEVRTTVPLDNRRNFKGRLLQATPEDIRLDCEGRTSDIPLTRVERARLRYFESSEKVL